MAFNLRGNTVPDGSITEAKLAPNSVSSTKIQNDAVTADKVTANLGIQHFLGSETELVNTGDTEITVGEFNFTKDSTATESWMSLGFSATLKSNDVGNAATLNIYIDSVLTYFDGTTSITPHLMADDAIDISALSNGNHLVELKLVNDQPTGVATLSKFDLYLGKKSV
jgi:hypothetical protein